MRKPRICSVVLTALAALMLMPVLPSFGLETRDICGDPPPPKPAQRASAESVPPLPLPATPMRRTEKKKPPEPPVIITKIEWGQKNDWATDLNDVNNLLIWLKTKLKMNFTYEVKPIEKLEFDPTRMPALYRTGHNAFAFTMQQRENLRKYAINGGFIIFDACCGRDEFTQSCLGELKQIFPETNPEPLAPDHPIYNCYYKIDTVKLHDPAGDMVAPAPLLGINIGCRTVAVFSPYDMSCGWDMHQHTGAKSIDSEDSLKLGANLIAYATATKTMGMSLSESRVYVDADVTKTDKFRVAQIMHEGEWDTDPAGLSTLLDTISAATSLKVSFDRKAVKLSDPEVSTFPFLYITGHKDFKLSDEELGVLRRYLQNGGFLLGDACCGRQTFDFAFRREMKRVLPEQSLAMIPPDHPVYRRPNAITTVQYTPAAITKMTTPTTSPMLEGITINGNLAVIYSKYDLGCGWELKPHPYGVGYESRSAISIGINTIIYAMTH